MKTLLVAVLLLALVPVTSRAQWMLDGTPLTAVPGGVGTRFAIADGAGGAIIAWSDDRAVNLDVYVQRVNNAGVPLWTLNGVALCTVANNQTVTGIVPDAAGGAIVTWEDARNGGINNDVYAQRVNASGVAQWTANGVAVCNAGDQQLSPRIASDGVGGAVVTWQDKRTTADYDIYAQRMNASGVAQWTANGVLLMARSEDQTGPEIVSVGVGGFVVVCQDDFFAPDIDIVAQRVNPSGVNQWGAQGVYVSLGPASETFPQLVSDGAGGAVITWRDPRSGNVDVYVQRLNAAGTPQWAVNGVQLTNVTGNELHASILADGSGGAVVSWTDERGGAYKDIYAQHVSPAGAATWLLNGVAVCTASDNQAFPAIASDGSNGYIFSWEDDRSGSGDVYAQRVNAVGSPQWAADGKPVCQAAGWQDPPVPVSDGAGGTIFTWKDFRSGGAANDIYVQRLDNVHGFPGHPEPILTSVADVKHDQGGFVAVNWKASGDDIINPRMIDFYSVWRAVDAIPLGSEALTLDGVKSRDLAAPAPVYLAAADYYFERVGTQSAHAWPGYSFATPTRADSIAAAPSDEKFMVAAHSLYDNFVAFASNVVTGHSVDNLAPAAPLLLTAQRVGTDVHLNWNRAVAPDLRDYAVYRATESGVTPVPIHFLESAEDTLAVDANAPSSALYYVVTAFDVHANQGPPSNEASVGALTAVGNTPSITALTVLQNHPNPFTATTDFEIGLPKAGDVRIEVFDVAGRRVRALEVLAKAGWNRVPFTPRDDRGRSLASGVYFYRVSAGGTAMTRKFVIAR